MGLTRPYMRHKRLPIELYTPKEAEMVSGMIYEPDKQGVLQAPLAPVWWISTHY